MGFCRRCGDIVSGPRCKCGGAPVEPSVKFDNTKKEDVRDRWSKTYVAVKEVANVPEESPAAPTPTSTITKDIPPKEKETQPLRPPSSTGRFPRPQGYGFGGNTTAKKPFNRISTTTTKATNVASTSKSRPSSPLKKEVPTDSEEAESIDDPTIIKSHITGSLVKVYGSILERPESLSTFSCHTCAMQFRPDATIYPSPADASKYLCRDCFEEEPGASKGTCEACRKSVLALKSEGTWIENGGRIWHAKCFKCRACDKEISDAPMVDIAGRPCCAECFEECLNTQTPSPSRKRPSQQAARSASKAARENLGGIKRSGDEGREEGSPVVEELTKRLGVTSRSREPSPSPFNVSASIPAANGRRAGGEVSPSIERLTRKLNSLASRETSPSPSPRAPSRSTSRSPTRLFVTPRAPNVLGSSSAESDYSDSGPPLPLLRSGSSSPTRLWGQKTASNNGSPSRVVAGKKMLATSVSSSSLNTSDLSSSPSHSNQSTPTTTPNESPSSSAGFRKGGTTDNIMTPVRKTSVGRLSAVAKRQSLIPTPVRRDSSAGASPIGVTAKPSPKPTVARGSTAAASPVTPQPSHSQRRGNITPQWTSPSTFLNSSVSIAKVSPSMTTSSSTGPLINTTPMPRPGRLFGNNKEKDLGPIGDYCSPPASTSRLPQRTPQARPTSRALTPNNLPTLDGKCCACDNNLFAADSSGRIVTIPCDGEGHETERYHHGCFRCATCGDSFGELDGKANFVRENGRPVHLSCASPLRVVRKSVSSPSLSQDARRFAPKRVDADSPVGSPSKPPSRAQPTVLPSPRAPGPMTMTKPKSMSVSTPGTGRFSCPGCNNVVYQMERGVVAGPQGSKWHSACLVCGGKEWMKAKKDRWRNSASTSTSASSADESAGVGCGKKLDSQARADKHGMVWCRDCIVLLSPSRKASPSPTRALSPMDTGNGGAYGRLFFPPPRSESSGRFVNLVNQYTGTTSAPPTSPLVPNFTGRSVSPVRRQGTGTTLLRSISPVKTHITGGGGALIPQVTGGGLPVTRPRPKSVMGTRSAGTANRGMFLVQQMTGGATPAF